MVVKLDELEKKKERHRTVMQRTCKHPIDQVIEGEFADNTYLRSSPPFRVCKVCGYSEEGWGCGYKKLNFNYKEVPTVSRDTAFEFRLGLFAGDEDEE